MSKGHITLSQVVSPFFPQMQLLHLSIKDSPTLQCLSVSLASWEGMGGRRRGKRRGEEVGGALSSSSPRIDCTLLQVLDDLFIDIWISVLIFPNPDLTEKVLLTPRYLARQLRL